MNKLLKSVAIVITVWYNNFVYVFVAVRDGLESLMRADGKRLRNTWTSSSSTTSGDLMRFGAINSVRIFLCSCDFSVTHPSDISVAPARIKI